MLVLKILFLIIAKNIFIGSLIFGVIVSFVGVVFKIGLIVVQLAVRYKVKLVVVRFKFFLGIVKFKFVILVIMGICFIVIMVIFSFSFQVFSILFVLSIQFVVRVIYVLGIGVGVSKLVVVMIIGFSKIIVVGMVLVINSLVSLIKSIFQVRCF